MNSSRDSRRGRALPAQPTLNLQSAFAGKRIFFIGGTGFLGKVCWTLLLARFPDIAHLYLMVRSRGEMTAEQRFWQDVATNEGLEPLRKIHGDRFEDFLREKITVVDGDVVQPFCGVDAILRDEARGKVDALFNASGVVDFQPPLDVALRGNAFGVRSLIQLAKDLGDVPMVHTSTCFVAGYRTGIVEERNPLEHPFPHAGKLERAHWDPEREIAECLDIIEQAKHRANDAFRQSQFLDQARANLRQAGEPATGQVLEDEIERVRRKFVEAQTSRFGQERAQFWGWPNTYTYTKSIGEQLVASSGLRFAIVRPAIVESCVSFPCVGWNEGINTSAPLIYAIREGQPQFPGAEIRLDIIPCDMVASGMLLALAEVLTKSQKSVYQFGTSDCNPTTMARLYELSGLYKRAHFLETGRGSVVENYLQRHFEGALLSAKAFERVGPRALARTTAEVSQLLDKAPKGPFADLVRPAARSLKAFSRKQGKVAHIIEQFIPFTAQLDYEFRCDNTRAANARLSEEERALLFWDPEKLDWRQWFFEVHAPGLEKWVFPALERKLKKPLRPSKRHQTLTAMFEEVTQRFDLSVALQRTEAEGLSRYTYRDCWERACAAASRLAASGVKPGDRVLLAGKNHPAWPLSFFGILLAGATVVPLDAEVDMETAQTLQRASGARVALFDARVKERLAGLDGLRCFELEAVTEAQDLKRDPVRVQEADIAVLIYTSGTTGSPKGVMLSHFNLTSLLASLGPLFPIGADDRLLSVLPLHHTFELTGGFLLPLSRGSRIIYLDELNGERLEHGLKAGRVTAMIGVPALWELIERRILNRVAELGPAASWMFDMALNVNQSLGKSLGVDAGQLLFGSVHRGLGGHLRFLVSGGAALGKSTHRLFGGLGLHLTEGYGLTEAGPVLAVGRAGPKSRLGVVGRAIPGVELKIMEPDERGVGEVVARGPGVMVGYSDNPEATEAALSDGWLRTGDLGKLDHRNRLSIVGREKDVVVSSSGENVYPDDVEARLGSIDYIKELAVLGVSDGRGGERVACAAVVETRATDAEPLERAELHRRARRELVKTVQSLPVSMRPSVLQLLDSPLPRTSTRKVRRNELREMLERLADGAQRGRRAVGADNLVRRTLASVARLEVGRIRPEQSLRGDLGCDSLILLELLAALEGTTGKSFDADRLNACQTVADVERLVSEVARTPVVGRSVDEAEQALTVPEPARRLAKAWLGQSQANFYGKYMHTKVSGRAYIPRNRSVLVIANHTSHLDMGLVKYALGSYGKRMVSLAAADYFFEGKWRKTFFENFSNLVPVSRSGSLRQALRTSSEQLRLGNVVLLFPEGTRSTSGQLQEFKPVIGYLSLENQVDILPIWLDGAQSALPKGAALLRGRKLSARIGPPLEYQRLRQLTEGMTTTDASRKVAELSRQAIVKLSEGGVLELSGDATQPESSVQSQSESQSEGFEAVLDGLRERYVPGVLTKELSYYLSLGEEKWTLRADPAGCRFERGRTVAQADCVMKTSTEMFQRIAGGYKPGTGEFMSGRVKISNVALMKSFQKFFALDQKVGATG